MSKRILIALMAISLLILGGAFLGAQEMQSPQQQQQQTPEVSEQDLQSFAAAYDSVQEIQQNLNQEINSQIEDSSFANETFQNYYQAYTTNNQEMLSELGSSEEQEFSELMEEITDLQSNQQEKMVEVIEDEGLTVQRFNGIIAAIQQDPDLYSRFQEISQN